MAAGYVFVPDRECLCEGCFGYLSNLMPTQTHNISFRVRWGFIDSHKRAIVEADGGESYECCRCKKSFKGRIPK
jgi:hypothetical protein